jgi:hypothetical protein
MLSTTFIPIIIIMHIYNWYHSITAGIHLHIRTQIIYTWHISPCFLLSFAPLLPHLCPLLLTWNPPCCDRIRPRCPRVARKLTLPFLSPGSYTPHSKIPTPRSFPAPHIPSLGQQCEPGSQDRAQIQQHIITRNRTMSMMTMMLLTVLALLSPATPPDVYKIGNKINKPRSQAVVQS